MVAHTRRGSLDGEPGLAAAAGADEGDEAALVEQVADLGHRLHAADEGGDRLRQVVGVLADRLQRGELPLEAFGLDLEEADRFGDVAQLVEAQVDELDAVGERARARHRLRQHDLATVGRGHDPGAAVGRRSEVVAVPGHDGYAAVQPDPDAERLHAARGYLDQRPLRGDRGRDGIGRDVEARKEPVAGELDHGAAVRGDGLPEDAVVEVHRRRHGVGVLLPLPRAGFDVGEHEGQLGADVGHRRPPCGAARSGVVGADTTVWGRATTVCDQAATQGIRVMRLVAP